MHPLGTSVRSSRSPRSKCRFGRWLCSFTFWLGCRFVQIQAGFGRFWKVPLASLCGKKAMGERYGSLGWSCSNLRGWVRSAHFPWRARVGTDWHTPALPRRWLEAVGFSKNTGETGNSSLPLTCEVARQRYFFAHQKLRIVVFGWERRKLFLFFCFGVLRDGGFLSQRCPWGFGR